MSVPAGRPRVIRRVSRRDRKGQPKLARDLRRLISMERVRASAPRTCHYRRCAQLIEAGEEYAKIIAPGDRSIRVRGMILSAARDYHFGCVPPETRPLVRLLKREAS